MSRVIRYSIEVRKLLKFPFAEFGEQRSTLKSSFSTKPHSEIRPLIQLEKSRPTANALCRSLAFTVGVGSLLRGDW